MIELIKELFVILPRYIELLEKRNAILSRSSDKFDFLRLCVLSNEMVLYTNSINEIFNKERQYLNLPDIHIEYERFKQLLTPTHYDTERIQKEIQKFDTKNKAVQ